MTVSYHSSNIIIGSLVGGCLLLFGLVFFTIGSLSWGVVNSKSRFVLIDETYFVSPIKENALNLFKIFAVSSTIIGLILLIAGIITCSMPYCVTEESKKDVPILPILPDNLSTIHIGNRRVTVDQMRTLNHFHLYPKINENTNRFLYTGFSLNNVHNNQPLSTQCRRDKTRNRLGMNVTCVHRIAKSAPPARRRGYQTNKIT